MSPEAHPPEAHPPKAHPPETIRAGRNGAAPSSPRVASGEDATRRREAPVVLVVDDAPDTLEVLQRNLASRDFSVLAARGAAEAVRILEVEPVDLVITDLKMPGASGLDLVRHVRENHRDTEVMMITGYPSLEGAVQAVKTGAEEYLAKPFTEVSRFSTTGVPRQLISIDIYK